jgi:hypothetical protein
MVKQSHTAGPATSLASDSWNRKRLHLTRDRGARQQGEQPRDAHQRERDSRQRQQEREQKRLKQRELKDRQRQREREREKKLQDTRDLQAAKLLMETPLRPNSFFTHLNEDIRNIVYSYLPLRPLEDGKQSASLVLSCREAKQEVEAAGARMFSLFLTKLKKNFEVGD